MGKSFTTHSAAGTQLLGKKFAQDVPPGTLLCLSGDLGAGKTTFVQGLLEGLGAARPFVSPTFVIMKQYDLPRPSANGIVRIYHADAYRIGTKDFEELGFREWREDLHGLVILEWPERVEDLVSENALTVTFASKSENEREIRIEA